MRACFNRLLYGSRQENSQATGSNQFPKPFSPLNYLSPELSVGTIGLGLCCLSYNNSKLLERQLKGAFPNKDEKEILRKAIDIEESWASLVNVESKRVWNEVDGDNYLASQCVTGVVRTLSNVPGVPSKLIPFVVFRGSTSAVDWLRDIMSVTTLGFISEKKRDFVSTMKSQNPSLKLSHEDNGVGRGFFEMYLALKQQTYKDDNGKAISLLQEIDRLTTEYDSGLIIAGHSLGGACANMLLLELVLDKPEFIELRKESIQLVTFGCPRSVSKQIAKHFDSLPILNYRFINNDDLITALAPKDSTVLHHSGKAIYPYLPSRVSALEKTMNPLDSSVLPDWENDQEHAQSKWMVVYDPADTEKNATFYDFAADGRANNNWAPYGTSFFLGPTVHSVAHEMGYSSHFEHYEECTTSKQAKRLREYQTKVVKEVTEG